MSIAEVIRGIFEIWGNISTIRDLLAGNAGSVITIADLERVVRGEHARFFNTIAFADIETIHNQFYNNWLPSVARHEHINANDINSPSGTLNHIFQDLIRVRAELAVLLNRVREVFRTYQNELHIDELVDGVLASMHGFALLFHIHGVYAELRRIQIGANSLNDERLLTDTRAAQQYLADAQAAVELFLTNAPTIQARRLDTISQLTYNSDTFLYPPSWSFGDAYRPRGATPASHSLYVYVNGIRLTESVARSRRAQHVVNVTNRMGEVFVGSADGVRREYSRAYVVLLERQCAQGGGGCLGQRPEFLPEMVDPLVLEDAYEYITIVPVDVAEFVALSEKIRKEASKCKEGCSDGLVRGERQIRAAF